jgi:predicted metal-dependent hydrolase
MMRVRMPKFDFSATRARWMRNGEFAQLLNAQSAGIPPLERFLNRVMAKARSEIKGDDQESIRLREDIATFVKQESAHTAIHSAFNQMLVRNGYDRIPELEAEIAAHYERLLNTKSLEFLCAYCEGFETLGPPQAGAWLDGEMDRHLEGGDLAVGTMWKWHIMEEFEHSHVCYDVFKRLHGGYFLRIYAYFFQFYCMFSMSKKVNDYLISEDRKHMTPSEIETSKKNEKIASNGLMSPLIRGMWKTLSPFYNPRSLVHPLGYQSMKDNLEEKWLINSSSA